MANPSLQIGNSNWAIKEDNLLGYSTAGTRFVPQPITMTRESAGTRVNSSGLVETVELLGSEEVTNGDFATDGTPSTNTWTLGWYSNTANVSISGGKITLTNSASESDSRAYTTNGVSSNNILITNQLYKLQYEVIANNGVTSFKYYSSSGVFIDAPIDLGVTHTIYIKNTSNQLFLFQNATTNSNISLDNVSIKESTKNNLARVDYDGTASSLLVEPERTNLITYSEAFDNAYWTKSGASVTSGFTSPDGTDNAFKLVEDTSTGNHFSSKGNIFTADGNTRGFSIFVKEGERRYIFITNVNTINNDINCVVFDTRDGVFTNTNDTTYILSRNVTALENSWYRIDFTSNTNSGAYDNFFVGISSSGTMSGASYTGDGTSGVYIYGAQCEEGSYPTSYIPTDGGTVTRVQDQYSKTGISNLINSEEGVLFVEMAALPQTGRISLSDGTSTNRISFKFTPTNIDFQYRVSSSYSYRVDVDLDTSINHKIAMSFDNGSFVGYLDGNPIGSIITGASLPANTLNSLQLNDGASADYFFGKVKQLQVFKTALTDPELAALTS